MTSASLATAANRQPKQSVPASHSATRHTPPQLGPLSDANASSRHRGAYDEARSTSQREEPPALRLHNRLDLQSVQQRKDVISRTLRQ